MDINFCTVANNSASTSGGGIFNSSTGTLKIKNSIVAGSTMGGDCVNESGGTFIALGKNFDTDGTGTALDSDFQQVTSAQLNLSPLSGVGFTLNDTLIPPTHALQAGSVAIDAATDCTETDGITPVNKDQLGVFRCKCDVGAYEVETSPGTTPPTAVCQNITVALDDAGIATIAAAQIDGGSTDDCHIATSLVMPNSFTCADLGENLVTLTVMDALGNMSTCTATVTVIDTTAPSISCPDNLTVVTNQGCTYTGSIGTASAIEECDSVTITNDAPVAFPKGTTTVTWKATDSSGNFATCTQTVTVVDEQAPAIACANVAAQSASANGSCSATVPDVTSIVRAQSNDNCTTQANLVITQSPTAGSTASGTGPHPITVTVKDADNNSTNCTVAFTVSDTTAPSITCSTNISVPAPTGQCEAVVSYATPAASDNCSVVGTPTCSPASGSTFPRGVTTITCQVSDAAGNANQCSFTVTVNDTQAPTIACPSNITTNTVNAGDASISVNFSSPVAADNCSGVSVVCMPPSGSQFPRGTTTVTCKATDTSNNQTTCSFTVNIFDQVIVDNANGKILRFVSATGEYDFFDCRKGTSLSGRGTVTITSCKVELRHTGPDPRRPDRNVSASVNTCTKTGSATVTYAGTTHTLSDSNMSNNAVGCP